MSETRHRRLRMLLHQLPPKTKLTKTKLTKTKSTKTKLTKTKLTKTKMKRPKMNRTSDRSLWRLPDV